MLRALWKIDVHLISTLVNKSLYYLFIFIIIIFIIIIIIIIRKNTFVHFWKRSLNLHRFKNLFKKRKLPKLNEFPNIYDVQIFTMICIHYRSVNVRQERKAFLSHRLIRTDVAVGVMLCAHSQRASKRVAYLIYTAYSMNKANFERRPKCEYFN